MSGTRVVRARREGGTLQADQAPHRAGRERGRGGDGRRTLALFFLFAGFYLLTSSGHLAAVDEETLYRVTESVVERHTVAIPDDAWGIVASEQDRPGPRYSQYEPGQSLLAVPLYLVGRALGDAFPDEARPYVVRCVVSWFNAFVTAATVALLYRLARSLGYRGRVALGTAAIYGAATMAWPYARTFFAEPLTGLLVLATFSLLQRATAAAAPGTGVDARRLVVAGVVAAAALATKPHAALAFPALGLYLLGRAGGPRREGRRWRYDSRRAARAALIWGGALLVASLPLLAYNAALYGGPLRTGYNTGRLTTLASPFFTGLYGMTLSPGKGLLWYSPPLLLALLAARPFYRRHHAEALTCLGVLLVHLAFYSRLTLWNGDWAWGPRYLLITLPLLVLPVAALLEATRGRRFVRALIGLVVALGLLVQLLGVLVNFVWERGRLYDAPDAAAREQARFFSPPASPLVTHGRALAARVAEWRPRAWPPTDTVELTDGFATIEGNPDRTLFPRWTTGAGRLTVRAAAPDFVVVKLTFFDHRPPALRGEPAVVAVNGRPLDPGALDRHDFSGTGEGWVYGFTVPPGALRGGTATVTLTVPPWNPRAAGQSARDEALGVFVNNVEVWRAGQPLAVYEGPRLFVPRAIAPLPSSPAALYTWFNDDRAFERASVTSSAHHLVDHWAWYAVVGGLGRTRTLAWLAGYAAIGAAFALAGLLLGASTLPRRPRRRPQRRARPRTS